MANAYITIEDITCIKGTNSEAYFSWQSEEVVPSLPATNIETKFWPVEEQKYYTFEAEGQSIKPNEKIRFPVDLPLRVWLREADETAGELNLNEDDRVAEQIITPTQNERKTIIFEGQADGYDVKFSLKYLITFE
jgi:hypothetical protein